MEREIIDPFKDNQRNIWDWESIKQTAFMEGMKAAKKEKAIEIALVGIEKGFDNELIKELTDLSEEKINELRQTK
jgi:hypothetical protein